MTSDTRQWSVPAPVRGLLWWPGVSFMLVIVAPSTIEATIVASGALLAVIGGLAAAAADRLREHRAEAAAAALPGATEAAPGGATAATLAGSTRTVAPGATRSGAPAARSGTVD